MTDMIGAQLYTLRDFLQTPGGIVESFRKLRAIGYKTVQVAGVGPIEPVELKKILNGEGLTAYSTHENYYKIRDELDSVIEKHRLLECSYVVTACPGEYRVSAEGFSKFAKEASIVAGKLREAGLGLGYHNHSFELEKFGGKTAMQIMLEESDPEVFHFEIDTYWIQHGGGDPAAYIRHWAGRVPLLHLKDMAVHKAEPVMAEVGEGNMNWGSIMYEAEKSGVEWYTVEQDYCLRDPFESLEISFKNLQNMLQVA